MVAINDWDWSTPETLTGNQPVTQTEVYFQLTVACFGQIIHDCFFGVGVFHAVEFAGVHHDTAFGICCFHIFQTQFFIFRLYYDGNRQVIFFREEEVAFVMGRYTHNSTGTIFVNNIVSDQNWHSFPVGRVDGMGTDIDTFFL